MPDSSNLWKSIDALSGSVSDEAWDRMEKLISDAGPYYCPECGTELMLMSTVRRKAEREYLDTGGMQHPTGFAAVHTDFSTRCAVCKARVHVEMKQTRRIT